MTDLYDIAQDVYQDLGELNHGLVESGTGTTLVDAKLKNRPTDHLLYGTAFLTYDEGAAGGSPEGKMREITAYAPSTGTLTFDTVTDSPVAGDRYAWASGNYALDDMIPIINQALRKLGRVPLLDETITSTSAVEYATPSGVNPAQIKEIWIQGNTGDADNNDWEEVLDWRINYGATYEIIFRSALVNSRTLRIVHMGVHPQVWLESTAIKTNIDRQRIVAEATYLALKWKKRQTNDTSKSMINAINDAASEVEDARRMYKVPIVQEPHKPILTNTAAKNRPNKYGPWDPS